MDPVLSPEWQRLDAYDRDIIITIGVLGEPRGVDVWQRIAPVEKRGSRSRFYSRLSSLVEREYVEREPDPDAPGETNRYSLATHTHVMLDRVREHLAGI